MADRRQRLIDETLAVLFEGRGENFSLRQITQKAEVSMSVLYSTFGSKEGLIAAAVQGFYMRQAAQYRSGSTDVAGILREIGDDAEVTMANPEYVRSLCDLYFLHQGGKAVFDEMNAISGDTFRPWLHKVVERGELRDAITVPMAEALLSGDRWHAISDWVRGHTPTDQFPETIRLRFLVTAAGLTRGATQDEVVAAIEPTSRRLREMGAS
ncbi:MAG TPA: TetR/AcrR family transcriptional regulator [Sphingomicrobium sp.]